MSVSIKQLITNNLDIWSAAIKKSATTGRGSSKKITLYGIKKLRELILDLAVRGLLVPQNSKDEPASVLLKKIATEKEKLIKAGEIKKQKQLPEISEAEKPYDLPQGWEWVKLGNLGVCSTGKTPSTKNLENFNGDIQFIGPGQITTSGELLESDKTLTELGTSSSTEANIGDILMVCIGGSIGKSVIINKRLAFNQQINAIKPIEISNKFLHASVSSSNFYKMIIEKSSGSATPIINRSNWEELIISIAPLSEQNRIVAKVDELMALCDQLEQQQENSISTHQTLVETLLSSLTNTSDQQQFNQSWTTIAANFDILFTTEHSIEQLKQTILQLAVMGKLVPQNPNDEAASVLLKKIASEKEKLIKAGKIKKPKPLPEISEAEKPYKLPKGWEWSRLGSLCILENGDRSKNYPNKSLLVEDGIPFINAGHLQNGLIDKSKMTFITEERYKILLGGKIKDQDILYCLRGSLGKLAIVKGFKQGAIASSLVIIRLLYNNFSHEYLFNYFNSLLAIRMIKQYDNGTAQPNLSSSDLGKFFVPIPPLPEQNRIVAKVDELMLLCDKLKQKIQQAQLTQLNLADAMVEKVLS